MVKIYNIELDENGDEILEPKTVTFSEDVNGWTSFKSFVPENGVSLSKKYFTFDKGRLFKHYVPQIYDWIDQDWKDHIDMGDGVEIKVTVKDAENYNIFYNNFEPKTYN